MDSRHAKTEAEWWASREIISLRQQLAECQAQTKQAKQEVLEHARQATDTLVKQAKREALLEVADWLSVEHGRIYEPIELRKIVEGMK
jgi:hypothetical protein